MLKALSVQNYALIEEITIDFRPGLSIITGETGAGKSILLGAMSLIFGQRADSEVLRNKEKKCVVEGSFNIHTYDLHDFFTENDLDYADQTVLRREIAPNGKSRAFINDTPVNLSVLRELALKLVDIHSQHENLEMNNQLFQLKVIDTCAGSMKLRKEYQSGYREYRSLEQKYLQMQQDAEKSRADLDYYQFQFNQISEAKILEDEEKELEGEQAVLTHAGEIRNNLSAVYEYLTGENGSAINLLKESAGLVQKISGYYPASVDILKRLESAWVELKDIAGETGSFAASVETDTERLTYVTERLDLINSLIQKHRVTSTRELLQLKNELQGKLSLITSYDSQLEELGRELQAGRERLKVMADKLTMLRRKAASGIQKDVSLMLKDLGIPNARFEIAMSTLPDFSNTGLDKAEFLFSANKQSDLLEISHVASGGEISRLMLAIKSLLTRSMDLPTIFFDEIDAGVSGEIAHKMGNMIREMAEHMQVINITHLPQIAAKGQQHYLVYKKDSKDATHTYIRLLTPEERITEIAKMISGEEVTSASYQNARELLGMN